MSLLSRLLFILVFIHLHYSQNNRNYHHNYHQNNDNNNINNNYVSNNNYCEASTRIDQIVALHELFEATNGNEWNYRLPLSIFGAKWNFSSIYASSSVYSQLRHHDHHILYEGSEVVNSELMPNPCGTGNVTWQGIVCNETIAKCNQSSFICEIIEIDLSAMNLVNRLPNGNDGLYANLSSVMVLDLSSNGLSGQLPLNIANMTSLIELNLQSNGFTGSIPIPSRLFVNMPNLTSINLQDNYWKGSLRELNMESNRNLSYFDIQYNEFTGRLPESLLALPSLQYLFLANNRFTSTLPSKIGQATSLVVIYLQNNNFVGALPSELSLLSNLEYFDCEANYFSASLPENIGNMSSLIYFSLYLNAFTGTVPSSIGLLGSLRSFTIDHNSFSGALPDNLDGMRDLQYLSVYNNFLSGRIPSSLARLGNLNTLILRTNMFTGNTYELFNVSNILQILDISVNELTGTLPDSMFGLWLETLSLGSNCFSGSIPNLMCKSVNLQAVSVSGLTAGTSCTHKFWPIYSQSPRYGRSVPGNLPSCVWELRNLTLLEAAGNGLRGSIPNNDYYGNLSTLDLSYNRLTGTFPDWLQTWPFSTLKLNNNKFSGAINDLGSLPYSYSSDEAGVTLDISVNRLSGIIPLQIERAENVNIVDGNLFSCSWAHQPPYHDPNSADYVCGSNLLDISLECILTALCIVAAILLYSWYVYWSRQRKATMTAPIDFSNNSAPKLEAPSQVKEFTLDWPMKQWSRKVNDIDLLEICANLMSWHSRTSDVLTEDPLHSIECNSLNAPQLALFIHTLRKLRLLAVVLCVTFCVVAIPLFASLKLNFGTYLYQYNWRISGAFLSGLTPTIAILAYWYFLILLLYLIAGEKSPVRAAIDEKGLDSYCSRLFCLLRRPIAMTSSLGHAADISLSRKTLVESFGPEAWTYNRIAAYVNLLAFFFVNVIVVLILKMIFVYILISAKTSFSVKVLMEACLSSFDLMWGFGLVPFVVFRVPRSSPQNRFFLKVILLYFNSIVAPCLAIVLTDSSCFQGIFVKNNSVLMAYEIPFCFFYGIHPTATGPCEIFASYTTSATFVPTFYYNHDCYSSLLTNYSPVFLLSYCFLGLVAPFLTIALVAYRPSAYWRSFFPRIFWIEETEIERDSDLGSASSASYADMNNSQGTRDTSSSSRNNHETHWWNPFYCARSINSNVMQSRKLRIRKLFQADRVMASMVHHLLVMLTFGALVPELGVMAGLVIVISTFQWEILIGRYLSLSPQCSKGRASAAEINSKFQSLSFGSATGASLSESDNISRIPMVPLTSKQRTEFDVVLSPLQLKGQTSVDIPNRTYAPTIPIPKPTDDMPSLSIIELGSDPKESIVQLPPYNGLVVSKSVTHATELIPSTSNRSDISSNNSVRLTTTSIAGGEIFNNQSEDKSGGLDKCCGKMWKAPARVMWMVVYFSCAFITLLLLDLVGDQLHFAQTYWIILATTAFPIVLVVFFELISLCSIGRSNPPIDTSGDKSSVGARGDVRAGAVWAHNDLNNDSDFATNSQDESTGESLSMRPSWRLSARLVWRTSSREPGLAAKPSEPDAVL